MEEDLVNREEPKQLIGYHFQGYPVTGEIQICVAELLMTEVIRETRHGCTSARGKLDRSTK